MECVDEYSHASSQLLYFPRCIPTKQVEKSLKSTTVFCQCVGSCTADSCPCYKRSGTFYEYNNSDDLESYKVRSKNFNKPTFECNEHCQCAHRLCGNKLVQCGPRRGLTVKICKDFEKGYGLFTKKPIMSGNFVCEYAGEIITEEQASTRFKINAKYHRMNYIFCIDEYFGDNNVKTFIDPSTYGNIGRYLNHSCDPNCVMVITRINYNVPILALFASKDIEEDEELNYDYGITDVRHEITDQNQTLCLCKSWNCKGFLPYDSRIV